MPSQMVNFKNYLQFLSFDQQISEINFAIDIINNLNNMCIDKKFTTIKELKKLKTELISNKKEIITLLCILFVSIDSISLNSGQ